MRKDVFGRSQRGQHKSYKLTSFPPDFKVAIAVTFTGLGRTVAAGFVAGLVTAGMKFSPVLPRRNGQRIQLTITG